MKKHALVIALLSVFGGAATQALAADGSITITGKVTGTTCTISGGTGGMPGSGANFPVMLDNVQVSALSADGVSAAAKRFYVHVGGSGTCPDGTKVAVVYENTSPAINPATGNLRNTAVATAARNVEVQIFDDQTTSAIDLRSGTASAAKTVTGGVASLPFSARYIASGGAAQPGLVSTNVQYSVTFP